MVVGFLDADAPKAVRWPAAATVDRKAQLLDLATVPDQAVDHRAPRIPAFRSREEKFSPGCSKVL